jgi:hypothetical protein
VSRFRIACVGVVIVAAVGLGALLWPRPGAFPPHAIWLRGLSGGFDLVPRRVPGGEPVPDLHLLGMSVGSFVPRSIWYATPRSLPERIRLWLGFYPRGARATYHRTGRTEDLHGETWSEFRLSPIVESRR